MNIDWAKIARAAHHNEQVGRFPVLNEKVERFITQSKKAAKVNLAANPPKLVVKMLTDGYPAHVIDYLHFPPAEQNPEIDRTPEFNAILHSEGKVLAVAMMDRNGTGVVFV